jgi:CBS domain-containing protein
MIRKLKTFFESRERIVYSVNGDTTIKDAVDLMNQHHIGALMVLDENDDVEGIFTERDVMKKLASTDDLVGHLKVREIMTPRSELITTDGESTIEELMILMTKSKIRHIPVLSAEGKLEGVLSMRDLLRMILKETQQKVESLNDYISGKYPA